jgi:hypothetical protein
MSPLSGVLGEAWTLYRRYFGHFILISFIVYLVIAAINALLSWGAGSIGAFIGLIFTIFAVFLLQAALVKAVQDVRDGRADLNLGETLSAALPFVGSVALASILASIAIGIGFILIIIPGLILLTFWSLIVPWIVLGGSSTFDSFGRSWRTVRGNGWHVFGTYVVVFLILIVGEIIVSVILLALPLGWRSFISTVVVDSLVAPFIAAVVTLVYYRLTAAHGEPSEAGAPPASGYGAPYGTPPPGGGYEPPASGYGSPYETPPSGGYGSSGSDPSETRPYESGFPPPPPPPPPSGG